MINYQIQIDKETENERNPPHSICIIKIGKLKEKGESEIHY
jgi:hypothetical protein